MSAALVAVLLAHVKVAGQNHFIDSLERVLVNEKADTAKVKTLNALSAQLWGIGKYDTAVICANDAATLAQQLNYPKGEGSAYMNAGTAFYYLGNDTNALENISKAVTIGGKTGNTSMLSAAYNLMGAFYYNQGNYSRALDYYGKSLPLNRQLGNTNGIANNYGNMGSVFRAQSDFDTALACFRKSFELHKVVDNRTGMSNNLGNMGNCYEDMAGIAKAKGKITAADSLYALALDHYNRALSIAKQNGYRSNIETNFTGIGNVFAKQGKLKIAGAYLDSALVIAKNIRVKGDIRYIYASKAKLDSLEGNYLLAWSDYENFIRYRDSLVNEANTKAQMNFEFNRKRAADKADQDRKDAVAEQEKKNETVVRNALISGCVLISLVGLLLFGRYRTKVKTTRLLGEQNRIIHEKNKDITDSITYARRIQEAILPDYAERQRLFPDIFILLLPRDIVSGDFYWYTEKNGKRIIAAVDCTGHGVPGAFMSMIGNAFLNETVNEKGITTPAEILNMLREKIIASLKQTGATGEARDGMDIAVLAFDDKNSTAEFAGANNPLWHCKKREGKIEVIRGDKQPIGYYKGEATSFSNHTISLAKGDMLYIFTDGFADQFGGPDGKKFKYKTLLELLESNAQLDTKEQERLLEKTFREWKGSLEQVDDVCVIGIRI